MSDKI